MFWSVLNMKHHASLALAGGFFFPSLAKLTILAEVIQVSTRSCPQAVAFGSSRQHSRIGLHLESTLQILLMHPLTSLAFSKKVAEASYVTCHLQAWSITHHPPRGNLWLMTRPRIHSGFSRAWRANSFNEKVVSHVCSTLCGQANGSSRPHHLLITGERATLNRGLSKPCTTTASPYPGDKPCVG